MSGGIIGTFFLTLGLFIFLIVSLILFAVKPVYGQPLSAVTCDPNNLTGKWRANDGATYFVRQIGSGTYSSVFWFGTRSLQEGTPFSNVFHGQFWGDPPRDGRSGGLAGEWLDVPLGNSRGQGSIYLSLDSAGQKLTKYMERGNGFSASEWIKDCRTLGDILKGPAKSPFVK